MRFEDYAEKYADVALERRDGILQVTIQYMELGGENTWFRGFRDLSYLFDDISRDVDNKVVILTGAGDVWPIRDVREVVFPRPKNSNLLSTPTEADGSPMRPNPDHKRLQSNLASIEIPMIGALNGPANCHAELPFLCDVVLAAEHASIQDISHIPHGMVPGDGVQIIWPALMGLGRARYFLMTGQTISAQDLLSFGAVNEVLPPEQLLPRAWELAEYFAQMPPLAIRGARVLLMQPLRRRMVDDLGYGIALEGVNEMAFALMSRR